MTSRAESAKVTDESLAKRALSYHSPEKIKEIGAHYTPPPLAAFLSARALEAVNLDGRTLRVLDPACGDGNLLAAVAALVQSKSGGRVSLFGLEQDGTAAAAARSRLCKFPNADVHIEVADFVQAVSAAAGPTRDLFSGATSLPVLEGPFDIIIANPPYVRTQVLGARAAQQLAGSLGLSGRVDLYHAFFHAMTLALAPGGTLALLCSNRFLSTVSGADTRRTLLTHYDVHAIFDLGDTRLFRAAVLPAIIIARRTETPRPGQSQFIRVYEDRSVATKRAPTYESVVDALEAAAEGAVEANGQRYSIERGVFKPPTDVSAPWMLSTNDSDYWLDTVRRHTALSFDDVARIRVGIKTTADSVFIRADWGAVPPSHRPEGVLLRPLLTHHVANRWLSKPPRKLVLYPHEMRDGKKSTISLERYPGAAAYLREHEARLRGREYVLAAGRAWYEIWVPHAPGDWAAPKLVCPDISETSRFFLDDSGSIVNGDCYWMTLREDAQVDILLLMLAVANSSLALKFYDTVCGNKLYAGRRRFITQYIKRFPLPDPAAALSKQIVRCCRDLLSAARIDTDLLPTFEAELDDLVWQSFGFTEQSPR